MKPFATTLDVGTSLSNLTGSWRTERPVYLDRLPPCNHACPAGENIQEWLYLAEEGDYEGAWQVIMRDNPMPAVMGRACYHSCETACNRGHLDEAVGIHAVERFLGDQAIKEGWKPKGIKPDSGKKVIVVGSGPGGLSAAYHLRRMGHKAVIYEASGKSGGMMRYGMPAYRLPRDILDVAISRIEDIGVTINLNSPVDDLPGLMASEGFDAAFLAVGAGQAKTIEIENDGSVEVIEAIRMLREIEDGAKTTVSDKSVIIYGGGNVAMDAARSVRRLGAVDITVIAVESAERMPAHEFEIREALEEGVKIVNLRSIARIENKIFTLETMVQDDANWPQPTGQLETRGADILVLAIGQKSDLGFLEGIEGLVIKNNTVHVNGAMMSGRDGIFAGGDMVPSAKTMTAAIGDGKKAAKNIDAYLRGETYTAPEKHEIVDIGMMNTWYYADAPKAVQPNLDMIRRQSGFEEVLGNLNDTNALLEARRCLSCGNCFECDNCYGVCPDNSITKLGAGNRFEFKYDYCKGCGMCATECPCGAIKMVPEDI